MKLKRNSTNFAKQLYEYFRTLKFENEYHYLKYYQYIVMMYLSEIDIDSRGLLIYHTMGMGKTILGSAIAMQTLEEKKYDVIFIMSKSLQSNFKNGIKKYVKIRSKHDSGYNLGKLDSGDMDKYIERNFSFVSMNAGNMINQVMKAAEGSVDKGFDKKLVSALDRKIEKVMSMGSLNGKLLIFDEAHNLFRAITNGSKNAIALYDMIMNSRNVKVIFLTGTPVNNDPFELVPMFNMLAGSRDSSVLPENYDDFNRYFIDPVNHGIKNKAKFQNRIMGLISHVSHKSKPGANAGISVAMQAEFPTDLPMKIEKVPMASQQYVTYLLARDKEHAEGTGYGPRGNFGHRSAPRLQKPNDGVSTSYRVKSRQLSNYCPEAKYLNSPLEDIPDDAIKSTKYDKIYANINKHKGSLGYLYSQFTGKGGLGSFARYLKARGWTEVVLSKDAKKRGGYSSDHSDSNDIISDHNDIIRTYDIPSDISDSDFSDIVYGGKDGSDGKATVKTAVNKASKDDKKTKNAKESRKFAIISGTVDIEDRQRLQDIYNSPENMHGGVLDLLLLSSTGAEGLDLKNTRHSHVMEPYWNWSRISQVKHRGSRNDSHKALPADEKDIQLYIYLADKPLELAGENKASESEDLYTTDVELFNKSMENHKLLTETFVMLQEASIECALNGGENCKMCSPTNADLYIKDIHKDMNAADPCLPFEEKKVSVKEIKVNGTTYYYKKDPDSTFGYQIYEYSKDLDGYQAMNDDITLFHDIIKAIRGD